MIPQSSVRKSSQPRLALYDCRSAIADCFDDLHYRDLSRRRRKPLQLQLTADEFFELSENVGITWLHDTGHAGRHIQQAQTFFGARLRHL